MPLQRMHGYGYMTTLTICRPAKHEMRYDPHETIDETSELVAANLACHKKCNVKCYVAIPDAERKCKSQ
jgi:hypothetical protein